MAILFSFIACAVPIKNQKTEIIHIYGNCGICKSVIEKAGNIKKIAKVTWDKDSKMATVTYDTTKTNQDAILKRIALSGYDSDKFLAPDKVYAQLPKCCQYERSALVSAVIETTIIDTPKTESKNNTTTTELKSDVPTFSLVFEKYFAIKDALILSDSKITASHAKDFLTAINAIPMEKLSTEEHTVWMSVLTDLKNDALKISSINDIEKQRQIFMALSQNIYSIMKVAKHETPFYFHHCPMYNDGKGADWLSKENTIKNPYFGAQMLNCGKTVETIK